ncbi:Ankyrin-1 [Labeo rohita]|uniref:Ankyrin-1 n=1 Tax=Labeo rohita TaxID=84645 RepID=A0ABQ8MPG5_LABRO|nr:Ankyrin-1 [Labeo rohita]
MTFFHYRDNQVPHKEVQHKDLENEKPPLPSRDQFKSMDSVDQSYEDVDTAPDYVEIEDELKPPVPQQPTITPHYTIVKTKNQEQDAVSEDYDDVIMPAINDSEEDYDDIG